jgi:hypothetical protein
MIRSFPHTHTLTARPAGRLFVEDCFVIRAEPRFTRAAQPTVADQILGLPAQISLTVTGLSFSAGRRAETVEVVSTAQRLGGRRGWWRCPACGRRCGVLLTPSLERPFWCRLCWGAVYRSDYRRRSRGTNLAWLLLGSGHSDEYQRLAALRARRRRGVRRGRHVRRRAERLARKMNRWGTQLMSIAGTPESRAAWAAVQRIEEQLKACDRRQRTTERR